MACCASATAAAAVACITHLTSPVSCTSSAPAPLDFLPTGIAIDETLHIMYLTSTSQVLYAITAYDGVDRKEMVVAGKVQTTGVTDGVGSVAR